MASDLSNIANLAKSDAMKARRDEFYRMQAGNVSNQLVITLPSVIEDDARDLFADIDAEESDDENRFVIHFNPQSSNINEEPATAVSFYSANNKVIISYTGITEKDALVTLYNLQGQQLLPFYKLDVSANKHELNTTGLSEGIYIASVIADGKRYTAKIFVK